MVSYLVKKAKICLRFLFISGYTITILFARDIRSSLFYLELAAKSAI
jgi:hypothetical protein